MARDISELGADVYDDSPKPKHKLSPKARNYIIGLSLTTAAIVGAVIGIVVLCNTALMDYSNVRNIKYYFTPANLLEPGQEKTAVLYKLDGEIKYPASFRIPSHVKGYKVVGVAEGAFSGHEEIEKVIMPNTIQFVQDKAFYKCTNLSTFVWSKNLEEVGEHVFDDTKFFNEITKDTTTTYSLPSGLLIYIGEDVFQKQTALISDEIDENEINYIKTTYGAEEVFKFSELKFSKLSAGIFKKNKKLVYLDLPKDFHTVQNYTFEECVNLQGLDATHSTLKTIGKNAFNGCTNLKYIELPEGLTSVGDYAFAKTGLTDSIPDLSKSKFIGKNVFANCKSLTKVIYSGTYVPDYAFNGCSKLSDFYWGDEENSNVGNVKSFGIGCFAKTKIKKFIVPENVSVIPDEMFTQNTALEKVSLWENRAQETTEVEITDEEGNISHQTVIKGITSIKANAFSGCSALKTINLYEFKDDGTFDYTGREGEFRFPKTLVKTDAYATIAGRDNSVFKATSVEELVIPQNLKTIGSYAFSGAKKLTKVSYDDFENTKLETISNNAFEKCESLTAIKLPKTLSTLGSSSFKECSKLESIDFKDTKVKAVNGETFLGCTKLTHIDLPETVSTIKKKAFSKTYSLDYVVVPKAITELDEDAFISCRREGEGKMAVYLNMTYLEAKGDGEMIIGKVNFKYSNLKGETSGFVDKTCQVYFLKGATDKENVPSTVDDAPKYWNGDINNPQEI